VDLIVIAKEPIPGRVKTRLCPPLGPDEAAELAAAAIADTLAAAQGSGADRVVVALDGRPGDWIPPGIDIVDQGDGDLDVRLARAWSHARGPFVQIGMDTPQIGAVDLAAAMAVLDGGGVDAVLGPAEDGGWWALGLRRPDPGLVLGIPTSRPDTGIRQRARIEAAGLLLRLLPVARDVDHWDDAVAVAAVAPHTRFADRLAALAGARR
jgi:uncharacterized protein